MSDCKHPEGPGHDCAYVENVNAVIPTAEREANRLVPGKYGPDWIRAFHAEMDRLCIPIGRKILDRPPCGFSNGKSERLPK